ncbi:MAG: DUF2905 domain-containing protein [Chitinophagales bacterium]|jgi:hypothetical protein
MPAGSKYLISAGVVLILLGVLFWVAQGRGWVIGRLPGDFYFEKGNFRLYAPLTTLLLLSLLFNLVLWLVKKWF